MIAEAIQRVMRGELLDGETMAAAMESVLGGRATHAQIAALAVALRMRGETVEELCAAARVMRRHAVPLAGRFDRLIDTCGTGGDGAGTFNISTTAAIVVAACGVRVAKHGNRAVSSKSGSADLLEALGVAVDAGAESAGASLDELGIAFLYAPAFHGALAYAAPVRRELGFRTFFNLLGPLANPAGATHHLLGVYDGARVRQLAEVLAALGVRGAWVVHGEGGLDEISPLGPTRVAVLRDGVRGIEERVVEPRDFGLEPVSRETIAGGDAPTNARIARAILAGERGGPRTAVVLNAAAALVVAGETEDLREAAERAAEAIDSGAAERLLARWAAHAPRGR